MIQVFIYCPDCRKNLLAEMPDAQVWEFENGERRCEDCRVTLRIEHVHNELIWNEDHNPELN